jgi:hypothetical protein
MHENPLLKSCLELARKKKKKNFIIYYDRNLGINSQDSYWLSSYEHDKLVLSSV